MYILVTCNYNYNRINRIYIQIYSIIYGYTKNQLVGTETASRRISSKINVIKDYEPLQYDDLVATYIFFLLLLIFWRGVV